MPQINLKNHILFTSKPVLTDFVDKGSASKIEKAVVIAPKNDPLNTRLMRLKDNKVFIYSFPFENIRVGSNHAQRVTNGVMQAGNSMSRATTDSDLLEKIKVDKVPKSLMEVFNRKV